jgi:hypothetical protein
MIYQSFAYIHRSDYVKQTISDHRFLRYLERVSQSRVGVHTTLGLSRTTLLLRDSLCTGPRRFLRSTERSLTSSTQNTGKTTRKTWLIDRGHLGKALQSTSTRNVLALASPQRPLHYASSHGRRYLLLCVFVRLSKATKRMRSSIIWPSDRFLLMHDLRHRM